MSFALAIHTLVNKPDIWPSGASFRIKFDLDDAGVYLLIVRDITA